MRAPAATQAHPAGWGCSAAAWLVRSQTAATVSSSRMRSTNWQSAPTKTKRVIVPGSGSSALPEHPTTQGSPQLARGSDDTGGGEPGEAGRWDRRACTAPACRWRSRASSSASPCAHQCLNICAARAAGSNLALVQLVPPGSPHRLVQLPTPHLHLPHAIAHQAFRAAVLGAR